MAIPKEVYKTFKKGSKTYFFSSLFFPKAAKEDVFMLYSFVRVADSFVDEIPQQKKEFLEFKQKFYQAYDGVLADNLIIDGFVKLMKKHDFELEWVTLFLNAMEMDLTKSEYHTIQETEEYMLGSAGVIGYMMCAVLGIPKSAFPQAKALGFAMQYANFIRDIDEDQELNRTYLPKTKLGTYNLVSLNKTKTTTNKEQLMKFITAQSEHFDKYQTEAEKGYKSIPKRYLIPIKTAADIYKWTVAVIKKDPMIVYRKKVKPSLARLLFYLTKNLLTVQLLK